MATKTRKATKTVSAKDRILASFARPAPMKGTTARHSGEILARIDLPNSEILDTLDTLVADGTVLVTRATKTGQSDWYYLPEYLT